MARVDPFLLEIPLQMIRDSDHETRRYHEQVREFLREIWVRSGGATDSVEDVEVSVTTQDGGNRTTRFHRDRLDEFDSMIGDLSKQNKLQQSIDALTEELSGNKRSFKSLEQEVREIKESLTISKSQSIDRDRIEGLELNVEQQKRKTRSLEQELNDIVERFNNAE